MLKIQFKDRRKPAMWLVDSTLKLGADPSCEIVVSESQIDPFQAEIVVQQDEILLRNLSKRRSIFINEFPIVKEHVLKAWDVIRIGESELEIIDPLKERAPDTTPIKENATVVRPAVSLWMLKAHSAPLDGQYFSLATGAIVGRDKTAEITIPLSYVSRQHAKIAIRNDKLYIEDLNSSNGTYINGERIQSAELKNGDELRFDQFIFNVIGPSSEADGKNRTVLRASKAPKQAPVAKSNSDVALKKIAASQSVFLHGLSKDVSGRVFEINSAENHISRLLGHHLSTSEKSVSARHVYLTEHPLGWEIKNNGASDGLLVNGKMQARVILQDGDEIVVGGTLLKFQSSGDIPLNYSAQQLPHSKPANKFVYVIISVVVVIGLYVALTSS